MIQNLRHLYCWLFIAVEPNFAAAERETGFCRQLENCLGLARSWRTMVATFYAVARAPHSNWQNVCTSSLQMNCTFTPTR